MIDYNPASMGGANAADWLTAIGTVGTLGATVALFWLDRHKRRQSEVRAQAELISSWVLHDTDRPVKYQGIRANLSNEPVYNILVMLEDGVSRDRDKLGEIHQSYVDQRDRIEGNPHCRFTSLLPPRSRQEFSFDLINANPNRLKPRPRVYTIFNDRNGVLWARDFNGKLTSLKRRRPWRPLMGRLVSRD